MEATAIQSLCSRYLDELQNAFAAFEGLLRMGLGVQQALDEAAHIRTHGVSSPNQALFVQAARVLLVLRRKVPFLGVIQFALLSSAVYIFN